MKAKIGLLAISMLLAVGGCSTYGKSGEGKMDSSDADSMRMPRQKNMENMPGQNAIDCDECEHNDDDTVKPE